MKELVVGLWLIYTILFIVCINPTFALALWAHEKSRQRLKHMLAKGGLAL